MVDTHSSVSDLQQIANLYQQVDNYLETQRDKERLADDNSTDTDDAIDHKQRLNDQAFFVLAWGQLEADIKAACRSVIQEGQSHSDWTNRRVWTLFNLNDSRLSGLRFESQLKLVLDRDSEYWRKTMQYYGIRNQIAHGNLQVERIDVSVAIQEFFDIRSSMTWE